MLIIILRLTPLISQCCLSIAKGATLNSLYFFRKSDQQMYCILFRVSVCYDIGNFKSNGIAANPPWSEVLQREGPWDRARC